MKYTTSYNSVISLKYTIGIDLGDRTHHFCVLDHQTGEALKEGTVTNNRLALRTFLKDSPDALGIIECE